MPAPTGQQKNKNGTPCISKRFRYMRKYFKKSFGFPKEFPKALFTACVDSDLDGRMGRILT